MLCMPTVSMHVYLVISFWVIIIAQSALICVFQKTASAGAQQPDAEYPGPDTADLFDLPRCNNNATGGLSNVQATVDPALVQLIEGMMSCLTQQPFPSSINPGLACLMLLSSSTCQLVWDQGRNFVVRDAGNEDPQCVQRWQLWPLLLGLMHWSPECGKATYSAAQEAVSNNMNCITICSTAFMAAVPAPDATDEVRLLRSLSLALSLSPRFRQLPCPCL